MLNIPLIPTPWKIVAAMVVFAAYTAFIFNKGYNYADGKIAKEENAAMVESIKQHNAEQSAILIKAVSDLKRQDDIKAMFDGLKGDLERSIREKPVYLNKDCAIDAQDLSIWNGEAK